MELGIFVAFALLAVASAIVVVAHRNPVYSTLSLVVTLVSTAAMFVLLGAPFIAALQILIYTGAIVVLFLFVIMLLNVRREAFAAAANQGQRWGAALAGAAFAGLLLVMLWRAYAGVPAQPLAADLVSLTGLARSLFTRYMLPFQIIGLLLLAAVTAATVLARRPDAVDLGDRGEGAGGEP
ncbi:MAG TPA: NADH-quinone oxidoreductase subunit J [Thermoanaerobaculia bacterium]|nr:NADH-quinone oxidoreductase subunit J [Thermoanaerobaculia bacterium]